MLATIFFFMDFIYSFNHFNLLKMLGGKKSPLLPSSVGKTIKILTPTHITCMKYLFNVSILFFISWKNFRCKEISLCYAPNYKKTTTKKIDRTFR